MTLWWVGLSWIAGISAILWIVGPAFIAANKPASPSYIANPYAATTVQHVLIIRAAFNEEDKWTVTCQYRV